MFGYLRPLRCELKLREMESYRAYYCGLCHALARRYGFRARFLLRYDLLFFLFTQTLWSRPGGMVGRRCPVHPFKRRCQACGDGHFEAAADLTVLLFDVKRRDALDDEGFLKRLTARLLGALMRRPVRRAGTARPMWSEAALSMRAALAAQEALRQPVLDAPAHVFAAFLSGLGEQWSGSSDETALSGLYYHVGRWLYLIDALDDLETDLKRRRYNPVALRFGLTADAVRKSGRKQKIPFLVRALSEEEREVLSCSLLCGRRAMEEALETLPEHPAMVFVRNTVCLGLPAVERLVWAGQYGKRRKADWKTE